MLRKKGCEAVPDQSKRILSQSKNVIQEGEFVRRPAHRWSPNVGSFMAYLEQKGLPVEHFVKIENGVEFTTYSQGVLIHPQKWSDEALFEIGKLTAKLHCAGETFIPDKQLGFKNWYLREIGDQQRIWCHGDIAPWNLLTKNEMPFCLVDWETSGPLDPMIELARICWLFPQLVDDDLAELYSLPIPEKRMAQVRLICEGYGLEQARRKKLPQKIVEVVICETAHEAIDPNITFEDTGALWGFAWRTRSLYWIWRNRRLLENALK